MEVVILVEESVRKRLNEQPWERLLNRLTVYANKKVRLRYWKGEAGGAPPDGGAEDFAMEAVTRVYEGKRHWEPEKNPDLYGYLCDVVDSLISAAVNSKANQERRIEAFPDDSFSQTPIERWDADDFVNGFIERLNDEPVLQQVVECLMDGLTRAEIALKLQLEANDVTNIQKRLKRRLDDYRRAHKSK